MSRDSKMAMVLVAAVLLTFGRTATFDFVQLDDRVNVSQNLLLNPPTAGRLALFWTEPYEHLYIPVTYTFWAAIALMAPMTQQEHGARVLDARPFHLANLLLHSLNTLVVWSLLTCVLGWNRTAPRGPAAETTKRRSPSALPGGAELGALLFALHPVQTEAVSWVTGTKDLLSGFLVLAALRLLLEWARRTPQGGAPASSNRRRRAMASDAAPWLAASYAVFVLAMLAKATAIVAPLAAGCLLYLAVGARPASAWRHCLAWVAIGLPAIVINKFLQADSQMAYTAPLWARPLLAADALAFYLRQLLAPIWLSPDYGRSAEYVMQSGAFTFSWLAPAALGLALAALPNRLWSLTSTALFTLGVLPVLGLVPFDFQTYSTVADRYLYLAMLGPALGLARLAEARRDGRFPRVALVLVVLLGCRAAAQTGAWRDSVTLFSRALEVTPRSYWMQNNLGFALSEEGRLDESRQHLEEALRIRPDLADAHNNLGTCYARREQMPQAIEHFRKCVELNPEHAEAHHNLGLALGKGGDTEGATAEFQKALQLNPNSAEFHNSMGIARARQGRFQDAGLHFRAALEISPGHPGAAANWRRLQARLEPGQGR
ncbi:MAG: tetratricopeptide repeat protein [Candidatus Wallbacteria bacterium]|nr:tetratricopeptide repeat protein [Candidatus Wallbacteria bacterium]